VLFVDSDYAGDLDKISEIFDSWKAAISLMSDFTSFVRIFLTCYVDALFWSNYVTMSYFN
jgi:hypothetical protein